MKRRANKIPLFGREPEVVGADASISRYSRAGEVQETKSHDRRAIPA